MEFRDTRKNKASRRTILWSLYNREINGMKTCMNCFRATYQTVYPNCTIIDVKTHPGYLRKFTPDGNHVIAFSDDLLFIEVYDYLGCAMAVNLLKNYQDNCISDDNVCLQIFEKLFKLRHRIKITNEQERLNRECSLFTENGYALVASSTHMYNNQRLQYYQMYSNNEALSPNPLFPLEDYTIYLVNINIGAICHSIQFKCDKIYLCHNQGIYLLKNTLAVLSVQHQVIHIYKIIQNRFCLIRSVGRFCFDDDHLLIASVYATMNCSMYNPFKENIINGLKQKLLIFLYKKAEQEVLKTGLQYPYKIFYRYFNQFLSLRMWKMQLLGENHVLIRYSSEEVITLKIHESNTQTGLFMIYDMDTSMVLDVFENTSGELLDIFERYSDNFRYPHDTLGGLMCSSPSNNIHAWKSYEKYKNTHLKAKFNVTETNRCILSRLPLAAQSFTSTPYLDKSLFIYDEEWISTIERPFPVSKHPIRFYSRDSGLFSFCLYTRESIIPEREALRLVAFTFHPTDPFAISVQRENFAFVVNFHIRKVYMPE